MEGEFEPAAGREVGHNEVEQVGRVQLLLGGEHPALSLPDREGDW